MYIYIHSYIHTHTHGNHGILSLFNIRGGGSSGGGLKLITRYNLKRIKQCHNHGHDIDGRIARRQQHTGSMSTDLGLLAALGERKELKST